MIAASDEEDPIAFDPPPFSLRTQPQRPGELAELIEVTLDATVARRVQAAADVAGLPLELALYIGIECERGLAEAVELIGVAREELIAFLEVAAADADERAPRHVLVRALAEYAGALTRGLGEPVEGPLRVRAPHRVAALWAHSAARAGVPFDRWLADAVGRAQLDRATWEAAAARTGRGVGEWVLVQAARCARSRSTSPQTTASG